MKEKENIRNFSLKELEAELIKMNAPRFRAKQIYSWVFKQGVAAFSDMNNIPKELIGRLEERYSIGVLSLEKSIIAGDSTEKFLFKLSDGKLIETVLIPAANRNTVCISTQVGCKYRCAFCASGLGGFVRDLTPAEIVGQALFVRSKFKQEITNYVFMGMGEPLDNFDNTVKAIALMNSPEGMNVGARRITVSTCGIIPGIKKLAGLGIQVNLSISLHAASNQLRNTLVPANKMFPLSDLIKACEKYIDETGRVITLEYVLIKNRNMSSKDAEKLAAIAKRLGAKVNLISYNEVSGLRLTPPETKEAFLFMELLKRKRINVTLRRSKGSSVGAACGQLAGKC